MLWRIIIAILLFIAFVWLITWVRNGGPARVIAHAAHYQNPVKGYLESAREQVPQIHAANDIPGFPTIGLAEGEVDDTIIRSYFETASGMSSYNNEADYDETMRRYYEAKDFGNPSPHRNQVTFQTYSLGTRESLASEEYVSIQASRSNTEPLNLSGWSIASAVTGTRVPFPGAVHLFRMGAINTSRTVSLAPGEVAIVATGFSPIGVSFRVNKCSGYLGQYQTFAPTLSRECPSPSSVLPQTAETINTYGESCFGFLSSLPRCTYTNSFPTTITDSCRAFIQNRISYNSCVSENSWRSSFYTGEWRLFLNSSSELWQNTHDVLRLLDEHGRTVSVWAY